MILKIVMWALIAGLVLLVIRLIKENDNLHKEVMDLRPKVEFPINEPREVEVTADKLVVDQPNNIMKMKFILYRPRKRGLVPPIDEKEIILETPYNNFNPGSGEDLQQAQISFLKELMKKNGYSTSMTYQEFQNFDLKQEENMKIVII